MKRLFQRLCSAAFSLSCIGLISGCGQSGPLDAGSITVDRPSTASAVSVQPAGAKIKEYYIGDPTGCPWAITQGPDRAMWFTDLCLYQVVRITGTGAITKFTNLKSVADSITSGPNNDLYFTELVPNLVGQMTTSGGLTEFQVPTAQSAVRSITRGADGNVWFTERSGDNIARMTSSGTITEFAVPTAGAGPNYITAGDGGTLWFTERFADKIAQFAIGANTYKEFAIPTPSSRPSGIALGLGYVWFVETDAGKVGRLSPGGTFTEFALDPLSSPSEIAPGCGVMWFTESGTNRIASITAAGKITEYNPPTPNSGPLAIALDANGNVWFTEAQATDTGPNVDQVGEILASSLPGDQMGDCQ